MKSEANHSISIGRDANGGSFVTGHNATVTNSHSKVDVNNSTATANVTGNNNVIGNNNRVSIKVEQANLPQPEAVNIKEELAALKMIFDGFNDPVTTAVAKTLEQEAEKEKPDADTVSSFLEIGLEKVRKLSDFANAIDSLRPHVEATAGWLGKHGHKLLPLVGLVI